MTAPSTVPVPEEPWIEVTGSRDLAAWLQRTGDFYGPLREAYSRTTAPMGAGRNMPSHYSSKRHRILPTFSEVGALAPFAGGVGFSLQWHKSKDLIMYTTGDGGAATNDFNVLFRQAAVHKLPVLMVVEDNGWAIRRRDPDDRRRHIVEISGEGMERVADLDKIVTGVEDQLLAGLDEREREQLQGLLSRVLEQAAGEEGVELASGDYAAAHASTGAGSP